MATYDSFDAAWQSQIRTITIPDLCSICYEPFSSNHQPVSSFGDQSCSHVFGATCLRVWLDSLNKRTITCPTCRQPWFLLAHNDNDRADTEDIEEANDNGVEDDEHGDPSDKEEDEESAEGGEDDASDDGDWDLEEDTTNTSSNTLENLTNRESAAVFVSTLYRELRICEIDAELSEIKACVTTALLDADLPASIPITDTLWGQISGMVKRMHRDSRQDWDDHVESNWVRRLARALNLSLNR